VIFDPACYFGDRETDLAFTRMFGGFDEAFYRGYRESWPLPDEWRDRAEISISTIFSIMRCSSAEAMPGRCNGWSITTCSYGTPWKSLAASAPRASVVLADPRALHGLLEAPPWKTIVSGEALLSSRRTLGQSRIGLLCALTMTFAKRGSVVARRELRLGIPESYLDPPPFSWQRSGQRSGMEVGRRPGRECLAARQDDRILAGGVDDPGNPRKRDWLCVGTAGGGLLQETSAIEIAIVAREGGCGSFWLADVELIDRTVREEPVHSTGESFWVADYRGEREFGGLAIRWTEAPSPAFVVKASPDGIVWNEVVRQGIAMSSLSLLSVGNLETRFLRLGCGRLSALVSVELVPVEAGEARDAPFYLLAKMGPRGWFPRYWQREQSYWTPVAPPEGEPRGLMNEEGLRGALRRDVLTGTVPLVTKAGS